LISLVALSGSSESEIPRIQDDHELAMKIRGRPEFVGSLAGAEFSNQNK